MAVSDKRFNRWHLLGIIFTIFGIFLFAYLLYSVGLAEILDSISRIGFGGFAIILGIYFIRIMIRGLAWKLSVYEPYKLSLFDTTQAVIIGEAVSSLIPLGILASGTAKAVAVKRRIPLIVGLSSVATENLFYSLVTGVFISLGAVVFLRNFELPEIWVLMLDLMLFGIIALTIVGFLAVYRQWHLISAICEKLYKAGIAKGILEKTGAAVRVFEDQIFGFYQKHPGRFLPIVLLQVLFHSLGVFEVWFVLNRVSEVAQGVYTAFLLESISRVITIVFKLIPFLIGIDEAGAQFVTETLALGAGLGVTVAIIRKGRILFWAAVGMLVILKRELSVAEIFDHKKAHSDYSVLEKQDQN